MRQLADTKTTSIHYFHDGAISLCLRMAHVETFHELFYFRDRQYFWDFFAVRRCLYTVHRIGVNDFFQLEVPEKCSQTTDDRGLTAGIDIALMKNFVILVDVYCSYFRETLIV